MRSWLGEQRSAITGEDVLYRLLGVLEGHEQKLDKAMAACKQMGAAREYFSIEQAASLTATSSSHLRRFIKKGDLPASNVGTAARPIWRIARKDLVEWMEKKKGEISNVPPSSELKDLIERHLPGLRGRKDSTTR